MQLETIVLDTNILTKDYNLRSNDLNQVIRIKDFLSVELCIPEVVYDECIYRYNNDIDDKLEAVLGDFINIEKMSLDIRKNKFNKEIISNNISLRKEQYKRRLDSYIAENKITILKYPVTSHKLIVKRMYDGIIPFKKQKNIEIGYKDFLIVESIRKYLRKKNKEVILFTRNIKDFTENKHEKNKLEKISSKYKIKNVYVTDKISIIYQDLFKSNLKENSDKYKKYNNKLISLIESAVNDNILLKDDIFGSIFFDPNINNLLVSISDFTIDENTEDKTLEIRCSCTIQFKCNFSIDSLMFEVFDENFIFYNKIKALTKDKEYWEYNFSDFHYFQEFNFEYLDFSFKEGVLDDNSIISMYIKNNVL